MKPLFIALIRALSLRGISFGIFAALICGLAAQPLPAQAAWSVFWSAGDTCEGGPNSTFTLGGANTRMTLCVSTTAPDEEKLCGFSARIKAANTAESGRFNIASRTLGASYADPNNPDVTFPVQVTFPARLSDLGGSFMDISNLPIPVIGNQALATFEFMPIFGATAESYVLSTDDFTSLSMDGDGMCQNPIDVAVPETSFTLATTSPQSTVRVRKLGSGAGTITSAPAGIDCGATCAAPFANGVPVQLIATPAPGSSFVAWTGRLCSAEAGNTSLTCTFSTIEDVRLDAEFAVTTYALTVNKSGTGSGRVQSAPVAIDCGDTCVSNFPYNSTVELLATADEGSVFTGWVNAPSCGGSTYCSFFMTQPRTVTATFTSLSALLTVSLQGTGQGSVSSVPAGINCGMDCTETLAVGTTVTLTASPVAGSSFAGWTGVNCTEGNNSNATCTFPLTRNFNVIATFNASAGANVALHDLNDDGKSDIVLRNDSSGANWVWSMNGTTIIAQGAVTTLPADWQIQSTAVDFDGDGKSDILLRNMTTGRPWIWFMNGNAVIGGGSLPTLADLNWIIAGTGDLNGDGRGDVIWRNTSTGQNWWWALNGTSIIAQGSITPLPPEWQIQSTLGDFNGDGKTDILWRNMTTGQPWIWLMDANAIVASNALPTLADLNWTIAGTGDLNGDGKHDVVWRNVSTGQNWYWALDGASIIAQGAITTLPSDWQIQSTSADFDGDGKADILLRNMTTGQPWIWFMNGNSITGGGALPMQSDFNWQIRIRK